MRHKKVELVVLFLLVIGLTGIKAQQAISASGGNGSGSGGSVSYTVGQVVYSTNTGTNRVISEGVQQPFEISIATGIEEAIGITLEIAVYPNPATDFVILKIENYDLQNLNYYLYNNNGILLDNSKILSGETNIQMNTMLPATYFLKVTDGNKVVKTFKIIKN
jgi:hypothetical protein